MSIPAGLDSLYSPEAEASVLAAPLVAGPEDRERVGRVLTDLPADAFGTEAHRIIWRTMQALHARGSVIDVVTVTDRLRDDGELERAGGMGYVADLLEAVPTAANVDYHQRILREKWGRRRVRDLARRLDRDAATASPEELRAALEGGPLLLAVNGQAPPGRSAAEILADPDARKPPEPVVEPVAWESRVTLFSAREKLGKTTCLAAATACVTSGRRWLGGPVEAGAVVWWAGSKESTAADVALRHDDFGGDARRLYLVEEVGEPFAALERAVAAWAPRLLVIDSLSALVEAAGLDLESGDSSGWGRVMGRLARIARESGAAVVVIHHGRKEDGSYRDSTAIGAAADMLVALSAGEMEDERRLIPVGRWPAHEVRVRLVEVDEGVSRFERVSGELSLDARILLHVERHPGCSTRDVRSGVQGRNREKDAALQRLLESGALEDRGAGQARALYVSDAKEGAESPENRMGTPRARLGHGESTGSGGTVPPGGRDPRKGVSPRGTPPDPAASDQKQETEARCADCGEPVEFNPAFSVQRCNPCALRASREGDDG